MSDLMTAYQEGREAAKSGKDIRDNPYDPVEADWGHEDWASGFGDERSSNPK